MLEIHKMNFTRDLKWLESENKNEKLLWDLNIYVQFSFVQPYRPKISIAERAIVVMTSQLQGR